MFVLPADALRCVAGPALGLVHEAAADPVLAAARPSLLAAVLLTVSRRIHGLTPAWPQALQRMTGERSAASS